MQDWIGADLINWRKGLNLTQEQAAVLLKISPRTIISWEKMETPIKRHVMLACRYIEENPSTRSRFARRTGT
jgi:transcriptional regulator with XRE-family HTH domain